MTHQLVVEASQLLSVSRHAIALTGAGISTPSGIPDFRSPTSGLWSKVNPFEVASLQGFRYRPEAFYEWIRPLATTILTSEPNPAHYALAQLETMGILKGVITQNIDLLHSRAGSRNIYEVHGHIREATCIQCFKVYPCEGILHSFLADEQRQVPRCPACNGVLKPNVVLFGEQLPARVLMAAQHKARQADLMLVAGSSLEVYPVADMPRIVKHNGGKLILVNLSQTEYDRVADVVIQGDVAEVLPQLVELLEGKER
jgi:NAD-dependent deacetylase